MGIPGLGRIKSLLSTPAQVEPAYNCPVCKSKVAGFVRLSDSYLKELETNLHIHPFFAYETLNLFNYECPHCHASDRQRLYALYFDKIAATLQKGRTYKMVDFAPTPSLSERIKQNSQIEYRTADLFMPGVDDVVDLTDMKIYADNSFDIFMCSHLLEHIYDDRKAMSELYRILKPGGWGIAMVPILLTLENTYEYPAAQTEAERWKHFGQFDHIRIYAKNDFTAKLKDTGFNLKLLGEDYFGADVFKKNGITPRSVLYVVEKPA